MNDDPLTVAGAATVLVPFGSSAPCSLLIPSTSRVGEPSVPVNVERSRRSRREATFVSAHATGSCRGNARSRMGIMLYHYICQRRLVLEVALGGGEDSTSAGRAPMKAATAEDLAFENASRQCSAIDRRRDPPSAALPVRRASEEKSWSIQSSRRYPEHFRYRRRAVQDRLCAMPIGRASPCICAARPAPSARRAGLASKTSSSSRSHWPGSSGRRIACERPWSLASQGARSISI